MTKSNGLPDAIKALAKSVHDRRDSAALTVLGTASDVISVLGSLFSLIVFVLTVLGVTSKVVGVEFVEDASETVVRMSLPFRLLVYLLACSVLAVGLGYILAILTKKSETGRIVLSSVLSVIWAVLMVTIADTLGNDNAADHNTLLPVFAFFIVIGLGFMLWILNIQLRAQLTTGNTVVTQDRALAIVVFVIGVVTTALLVRFGVS